MQILDKTYTGFSPLIDFNEYCPEEKALYIDIETTGLSKEKTSLYLIGCGYYKNNNFCTKLFFADNSSEELTILLEYIEFSKNFTHLFHFNGTKFDIPYLQYKANKYDLGNIFEHLTSVDVYVSLKPLRQLLFPVSMRQKCIEDFMEITREDKYNGGELIEFYHRYEKDHNKEDFDALITHNLEDVLGMHKIMPVLHFLKLQGHPLIYKEYKINEYKDYTGNTGKEIIITFTSSVSFPKSFSSRTDTMYLKANSKDNTFTFRLPILTGEMKLFFDNYKDYFYIPDKDMCIHKSVAMGLDKKSYVKASKDNCYTKISGDFIKQPGKLFTPSLKSAYKDKSNYFKFPDNFDITKADDFGNELLDVFFHLRRK